MFFFLELFIPVSSVGMSQNGQHNGCTVYLPLYQNKNVLNVSGPEGYQYFILIAEER